MRAFFSIMLVAGLGAPPALAAHRLDGPFDDSVASYSLVSNGDFESHSGSSLSSWSDYTGGLQGWDNRAAYSGGASLGLLDQTWSNTGAGVATVQSVSVTHRSWYVLSGYIHNAISGGGNAYLDLADVSFTQADGGSGDCTSSSTSGHGDWQFVYCEFYVPNGTHSVTVRTVTDATIHVGSYVWFDEVALTPSASFSPPESLSDDGDGDGYSELDGDCDDADSSLSPGASELCDGIDNDCDGAVDEASAVDASTWYADSDGDGYGDAGSATAACSQPVGYLSDHSDCDDTDAAAHPGADEYCDGHDDDCDGDVDEDAAVDAATWYADADGDGFGDAGSTTAACSMPSGYVADASDCDDGDAAAHPGADEYCDGHDDDCDGDVDEDAAVDAATWYADADGDGFGDAGSSTVSCSLPTGYTADATDCDDGDGSVHPGADETCDGADDDCDGDVDEDSAVDAPTWYADSDGDGYGDAASDRAACSQPSGYVDLDTDCDDGDASAYPGADEYCDGHDDDCDGDVDEDDAVDASTWHPDGDGDGYGDLSSGSSACSQPTGSVADGTDCDDRNAAVFPGADEYCNSYDDDCDGVVDESDAVDAGSWYVDSDGDGYGDPTTTVEGCSQPSYSSTDNSDCDDSMASVHPGATEVWYDGIDQDCDGNDDDRDEDGYGIEDDCDEDNPYVNPGATEVWYDGVDQDCSGGSDYDRDGDGHDSASHHGDDCDDADAAVYPGAPDEPYDGVISDCDASDEFDADGDGFDSDAHGGTDCDDASSDVHPEAEEIWYDGVDQDCDGNDDDQDGDGWPLDQDCDDTDASLHEDCDPVVDTGDTDVIPQDTGDSDVPRDSDAPIPGDVYMGGGGFRCGGGGVVGLWLALLAGLIGVTRRRT
jgi:hypothetical protein